MSYSGKKNLYNFLKEKGYDVPGIAEIEYSKFKGSEKLKFFELSLFSPSRNVNYVTVTGETEEGEKITLEYSKYVDGVLSYQLKNGKCTVMFGKPYEKIAV